MLTKANSKYVYGYLGLMLIATSGAFIWQFFMPNLAANYSIWSQSNGWQREIALWNVGIMSSILVAFLKKNDAYASILAFFSTVLCFVLGLNHLIALFSVVDGNKTIHAMGVIEVLIIGGLGGIFTLMKADFFHMAQK
ncbi:hypothetical protein [Paenibacillus sp. NAIST15-1]|uniref:hypothetical protein n=1 Tax=Paenibacillus sp. NAIST15-1 TaxID=1605994 RepID=UPI00086E3DE3|nr:hypothetical protein [Paenibacillus sp. NAIST15-1]GAV15870.1 hypothetical protein PBN151_5855 [Paenibacillus sp. NAIST15-1]